jgi:hypothetical protein
MYATFFPDDCPPADAVDLIGDVYRLVDSNLPSDWDFQSKHERSNKVTAGQRTKLFRGRLKRHCIRGDGLSARHRRHCDLPPVIRHA